MSPHVPDPAPRRPRLLRRAALLVATAAAALAFTHALAAIATTEGRLEPDGHAARTAERLAAEAQERDVARFRSGGGCRREHDAAAAGRTDESV